MSRILVSESPNTEPIYIYIYIGTCFLSIYDIARYC